MVDDLKTHGLTEHPEIASPQIISFLDQQMDELFTPYLTGVAYIDREKKSLEELYSSLLFKFTLYHVGSPSTRLCRLLANSLTGTAEKDHVNIVSRPSRAKKSSADGFGA